MIEELTLKNFKSFGNEPQTVKIAPITLILGQNSAGKSSIFKSLLAMKQTLESQDENIHLLTNGNLVNIGDFVSDVIFKPNTKSKNPNHFEIELKFSTYHKIFDTNKKTNRYLEGSQRFNYNFLPQFEKIFIDELQITSKQKEKIVSTGQHQDILSTGHKSIEDIDILFKYKNYDIKSQNLTYSITPNSEINKKVTKMFSTLPSFIVKEYLIKSLSDFLNPPQAFSPKQLNSYNLLSIQLPASNNDHDLTILGYPITRKNKISQTKKKTHIEEVKDIISKLSIKLNDYEVQIIFEDSFNKLLILRLISTKNDYKLTAYEISEDYKMKKVNKKLYFSKLKEQDIFYPFKEYNIIEYLQNHSIPEIELNYIGNPIAYSPNNIEIILKAKKQYKFNLNADPQEYLWLAPDKIDSQTKKWFTDEMGKNYRGNMHWHFNFFRPIQKYFDDIEMSNSGPRSNLSLSQLYHIGPLRDTPQRYYPRQGYDSSFVGSQGEKTPYILIQNNQDIEKFNKILLNFDIGYTVVKTQRERYPIFHIQLKDLTSGAEVNLADTGFGVSQILPILLQAYYPKTNYQILLIEQPEIHLNPKLQGNLAQFFTDIVNRKDDLSKLLIETHSEYLLLKLQSLVRKGELSPDDIIINYISKSENGAKIKHINLDINGEFSDRWPDDLFNYSYDFLTG